MFYYKMASGGQLVNVGGINNTIPITIGGFGKRKSRKHKRKSHKSRKRKSHKSRKQKC